MVSGGRELYEKTSERLCTWERLPADAKQRWEENAVRYNEKVAQYRAEHPVPR